MKRLHDNKPYTEDADLIAKHKQGGKVTNRAILRVLAVAKLYAHDFEIKYIPLSTEIIDVIATKLAPKALWQDAQIKAQRAGNTKRLIDKNKLHQSWQDMAN